MPEEEVDVVKVLGRRWRLVLWVVLGSVALSGLVSMLQPERYRAEAKAVVQGTGSAFDRGSDGDAASNLTHTMADLLDSEAVAVAAATALGDPGRAAEVQEATGVSLRPTSSVMAVTYDAAGAEPAVTGLEAVLAAFTARIDEQFGERGTTVEVSVFDPPHFDAQVQPRPLLNLALALVLGVAFGVLAALLRDRTDDRLRTLPAAERAFGQAAAAVVATDADRAAESEAAARLLAVAFAKRYGARPGMVVAVSGDAPLTPDQVARELQAHGLHAGVEAAPPLTEPDGAATAARASAVVVQAVLREMTETDLAAVRRALDALGVREGARHLVVAGRRRDLRGRAAETGPVVATNGDAKRSSSAPPVPLPWRPSA